MYTYLATALIAASLAATGTWKVQNWRYEAKEKARAEQQLESERLIAKANLRNAENVITAQNAAAARIRQLMLDAARARATADGLRTSISGALSAAANDHAACVERANTLGELLVTVEEAGRGMAEKADLHANDALKVIEAWPQ